MAAGGDNLSEANGAETRYAAVAASFASDPNVTYQAATPGSRRFGSTSLKVNDKIFAMLVRGSLVVKLPRGRVDELVASGAGLPFDTGSGRVMREWVSLPVGSSADWHELAVEALAFVGPRG